MIELGVSLPAIWPAKLDLKPVPGWIYSPIFIDRLLDWRSTPREWIEPLLLLAQQFLVHQLAKLQRQRIAHAVVDKLAVLVASDDPCR